MKFFSILLFFLVFGVVVQVQEARAGTGDNVSGWAWSSNIGWVSLNCIDEGVCPPGGPDYGVTVDDLTGEFSGYAWSSNIGWISFNRTETNTPPDGYVCPSGGTCIAHLNFATGKVTGWARALAACKDSLWNAVTEECTGSGAGDLAGGWDGWVKMRDPSFDAQAVVWDPGTQALSGFAWGSDVVGWFNFWDATADVDPRPSAVNLQAVSADYCKFAYPPVVLSWEYQGVSAQDQYQVQIAEDAGFTSIVHDTCIPAPGTCSPGNSSSGYAVPASAALAFNPPHTTPYYWQVKVWNGSGIESDWAGSSFSTEEERPRPDFTASPSAPAVAEKVAFADETQGPAPDSVNWNFGDGNTAGPLTPPNTDATHEYTTPGVYTVELRVQKGAVECTTTKAIGVSAVFPEWREVSPF